MGYWRSDHDISDPSSADTSLYNEICDANPNTYTPLTYVTHEPKWNSTKGIKTTASMCSDKCDIIKGVGLILEDISTYDMHAGVTMDLLLIGVDY